MPNGKPGDHPLSDILTHGLPTYGPEIDGLIREIDALEGPNGTALADPEIQEILLRAETDSGLLERLRARLLKIRAELRGERD
jgi:hypothetical protein